MDTLRSRQRDEGLRRVGTWTRRMTAAAVISFAALMAGFAHVLPNLAAHLPGFRPDQGTTGQNSTTQPGQPAQPPGSGTGSGNVVSGAS